MIEAQQPMRHDKAAIIGAIVLLERIETTRTNNGTTEQTRLPQITFGGVAILFTHNYLTMTFTFLARLFCAYT